MGAASQASNAILSEQIAVRQSPVEQSHTAGFDVRVPMRFSTHSAEFETEYCTAHVCQACVFTAFMSSCCYWTIVVLRWAGMDACKRGCIGVCLHSRHYSRQLWGRTGLLHQHSFTSHRDISGEDAQLLVHCKMQCETWFVLLLGRLPPVSSADNECVPARASCMQ